ncbi:hypothetical protein SAMN02745181_0976 [Rubritalea squalenifaciens DSM 18772]|uniref:Uncharacterized protein n=1 Tax=Rubritalea squalenifaciens DSM 18772 TaxID=1123071 RepID=A0A1M6E9S2_9BACT|nr:hypothetical protein [Rubritalea squalenifaciens]SHI82267.1 hypothetical protein SAMN02745181_0976 [Rubritalea squalenifaciens DSM 18772]
MNLRDPFLFLIGDRGAIQRISGSWWSLLVGALLVVTAGIARNYDHLSFTHDLEWIYGPFLASILSSLFIFGLGCFRFAFVPGAKNSYLSFLSLYWMTAPCAWLYGIPVERFTDILTATKWNVAFLAIVSLWRVALMIRSLQVLGGEPLLRCAMRIIFPASLIMMVASYKKGTELVGIMSGVRLSPHEVFIRDAANFTTIVSFWAALISLLTIIIHLFRKGQPPQPLPWKKESAPRKTIALACGFVIAAISFTFPLQLKTHRNATLTNLLKEAHYRQAIDYAAQFNREDFLTHHYFPPGPEYSGDIIYLLAHSKPDDPKWFTEIWLNDLHLDNEEDSLNSYYMEIMLDKKNPDYTPYNEQLWKLITERYHLPSDLSPKSPDNDPFQL